MKRYVWFRRIISALVLIFISLGLWGVFRPAFIGLSLLQFGQIFADMSVGVAVLCLFVLLLSFVFGRVYCSMLCPLGVFQDIAAAMGKFVTKSKYSFHKRLKLLRYLIFAVAVALFIFGIPGVISVLDPYSIYIRGASQLSDNTVGFVSELAAPVLRNFDIYMSYSPGRFALMPVLIFAAIFLAAFFRGRIFCNTLCPVGMILGCASQAQVIRPAFKDNCVSCGKCESVCKSECISVADKLIDSSRCVMCGNCAEACPAAAMDFSKNNIKYEPEKRGTVKSIASVALFMALPLLKAKGFIFPGKIGKNDLYPQVPAGAMSWARLLDKCVGCHACVKSCPSKVLEPAGGKYGFVGAMKPALNFKNGFCQYDCVECGQTCPFGAIMSINVEEKHKAQTGTASYDRKLCVIITNGERCGACAEHCPTGALEIVPDETGVSVPSVNQKLCVGCGACEYMCPVVPQKAIIVNPLPVHQTAEILQFQDNNVEESDDGFRF